MLDQTDRLQVSLAEAPALLKVIVLILIWITLWLPGAIPLVAQLNWHPSKPLSAEQKLPLLALLYLIAPFLVWGMSWVEGLSLEDYGLVWKTSVLVSLAGGLALSVLSLVVVFYLQRALGWIAWGWEEKSDSIDIDTKNNLKHFVSELSSVWLPILLLGLFISGIEELVFRGVILTELQLDYSAEVAAVISSLIFSGLHLIWEQQETLPQLPGLWLMGMILVLARACDGGSLGLAWGLHAGWIWGIASLDATGVITYTGKASVWITGFAEKPLAGVTGMLCLLGTGGILWLLV